MEDLYPLTYFNNSKNEKQKRTLKKGNSKKYTLKKIKYSKSESDFIIKTVKEKRKIIRKYLRKKNKIVPDINYTNSKERITTYKKGNNVRKIIRKNKLELSDCIENKGGKNLKLFGNKRYNKNSPNLFVEDLKRKISSKKMGLIPMLTSRENENDLYREPEYIYSIQRNLSMSRRFQYNKKEEILKAQKDYYKNNTYYNIVQLWWKRIPQIVKIQKVFKGYLVRNKIKPIFQLYKFMQYFENFLINIKLKKTLTDILIYSIFKGRKKIDGIYYSKENKIVTKDILKDIIMIQNNFRCYLAKTKKNFLLRKKRGYIINKISFISKKIYIEQNKINNNIIMLQNHVKDLIKRNKYFHKSLIHKSKGIYYFEKIYLSYKNQKIIQFVKLIRHVLQILTFKKKIFYKNPNEYDLDDLNKVRFIQKNYLNHYYNNIKHISFRNKNIDSNNNNINNSSHITKERIINVNDKFLFLQKMIKYYIIKRIAIKSHINKKYINVNYLITKENLKMNDCISKISHFQTIYKNQYKKNKNNIIDYEEHSIDDSSYDDYTDRDNKTLRQLTYRNRIPKRRCPGLYITKIRKKENINKNINNCNNIMQHQEGILITKKRYYNNENQIKKIQNLIKKRRNPDILLQRPLTNNYNFFSINTDSYDDEFLFSKKMNNYDYQSKIRKYNIDDKIKKIQKKFLEYNNISKNKINSYKKEKNKICLITKYLKKDDNIKQINIKFLLLISLFIKKNIQQYIFYLLKQDLKNFEYPFCLNTIYRVLKYLNSNDYKGNTVKIILNNILKNINSNYTIKKDLILLLNKEQESQLRDINIYELKENVCLDYIFGFSAFDKNLTNEKFLNIRLNNTKFYNTNIYTITKFIDDEFENFVKGKYCFKCYLDLNICKCSKEDLTDESLDIEINDDYNPKNSIKFFEYNINKDNGTIIKVKPKIEQNREIITKNKLINNDINKKELIFILNKIIFMFSKKMHRTFKNLIP